jgi:hypothetical protein
MWLLAGLALALALAVVKANFNWLGLGLGLESGVRGVINRRSDCI